MSAEETLSVVHRRTLVLAGLGAVDYVPLRPFLVSQVSMAFCAYSAIQDTYLAPALKRSGTTRRE